MARHPRALGMPHLSPPDDRDGRYDPGEDPFPADHLVRSRLAGDQVQKRLSTKSLEQTLGARYRVAWSMLQRVWVAMVRAERVPVGDRRSG